MLSNRLPVLLTRVQVCGLFGINARTLRRWELRGLIAALRVGRTVRFHAAEVERLLALTPPR